MPLYCSRLFCQILALGLVSAAVAQTGPWPLERKDRWGTAKATKGPAVHGTPWISNYIGEGNACSHGPGLGPGNMGYVGFWNNKTIYKFDYTNGDIYGQFVSSNFVTSTPAVLDANSMYFKTENTSGNMYGMSTSTFTPAWTSPNDAYAGSPNIGPDGNIVGATWGGTARKINAATGTAIWTRTGLGNVYIDNGGGGTVPFSRDDSLVFICGGNKVHALNYSDGTTAWQFDCLSQTGQAAVAPDGTIVVGTSGGYAYAINPDGTQRWKRFLGGQQTPPPAFDGTYAYMAGFSGALYKLNLTNGRITWSYYTPYRMVGGPIVGFDHTVYVFTTAGHFYAVDRYGAEIWTVNLGGPGRGSFTLGEDGTLYVGRNGSNDLHSMVMLRTTPATCIGTVTFTGYLGTIPANVDLDLRVSGFNTPVGGAICTLTPTATASQAKYKAVMNMPYYQTGNGAKGLYTLSCKLGSYLRKNVNMDLRSGKATLVNFRLVNGDVVENNKVDQADIDAVDAALGSVSGDGNWNERADLNGDAIVNADDRAIAVKYKGRLGDQ